MTREPTMTKGGRQSNWILFISKMSYHNICVWYLACMSPQRCYIVKYPLTPVLPHTYALQMWLLAITGVLCKQQSCDWLSYWPVQTQLWLLCTNCWTRLGNRACHSIKGRFCPAEELLFPFPGSWTDILVVLNPTHTFDAWPDNLWYIPYAVTCDSWQLDCVWCCTTCYASHDATTCYHHKRTCSCIPLQSFHDFQLYVRMYVWTYVRMYVCTYVCCTPQLLMWHVATVLNGIVLCVKCCRNWDSTVSIHLWLQCAIGTRNCKINALPIQSTGLVTSHDITWCSL